MRGVTQRASRMKSSKDIFYLLLTIFAIIPNFQTQFCEPPSIKATSSYAVQKPSIQSKGDYVYIGGLFDLHAAGSTPYSCGNLRHTGVQSLEAFIWAIKTFPTRYPNILSKVGVGGFAFDTCSNPNRLLQQVLNLETCQLSYGSPLVLPSSVIGYVGIDNDEEAISAGEVLSSMTKTLITHAARSPTLSNTTEYPYVLRTIPSESDDVDAIIMVLKKMNWKFVQTISGDDVSDVTALKAFREAVSKHICIVNSVHVPASSSDKQMDDVIMNLLEKRSTRVVVVFASHDIKEKLLAASSQNSQTPGVFTWVTRTTLGVEKTNDNRLKVAASGGIVVNLDNNVVGGSEFTDYFLNLKPENNTENPWFVEYWESVFQCYLPGRPKMFNAECDVTKQALKGKVVIDQSVPFVIQAVDAIVNGLEAAWRNKCPDAEKPCSNFNNDKKKWDLIFNEIKKVNIKGVAFKDDTTTGDTANTLHCIKNYHQPDLLSNSYSFQKVGIRNVSSSDVRELLEDGLVRVYDSSNQRISDPESTCDAPCTECAHLVSSTTSTVSAQPSTTTIPSPATKIVTEVPSEDPKPTIITTVQSLKIREGRWVFALIVLAGLGLFLVVVFEIYLMSKIIGAPLIKHWRTMWLGQLLLFAIFLCYLVLFAFIPTPSVITCAIIRFGVGVAYSMCFSIMLVKLMIILSSKTVGYLKGIYQVLMFVFAWGVQIVVDVEWLILREPGTKLDNITGTEQIVCSEDFSAHVQSLVYVMFLIVVTTVLAMRTHGITTNHREGIFIGLCSGFSIPVWITWVIVGMLNPEKDYEDPCLAFGLLITATLILFIMFLPKVRQLNSMGVEGIYAEDDQVDFSGSVIQGNSVIHGNLPPGSIVYSPPAYKSGKSNPVIYANADFVDGDTLRAPPTPRLTSHMQEHALYLKHPNTAASVRSAPPVYASLPRPRPDSVHHSTRVLKVSGDLSGRLPNDRKPQSELNYGTTRSSKYHTSGSRNGTLKRPRSLQDLGSL